MARYMIASLLALALVLGLAGCDKKKDDITGPGTQTPASSAVYVLNTIGKTISVINVSKGTVANNVATLGTWPNQVLYSNGRLYAVNSGSANIQVFTVTDSSLTAEGTIDVGSGTNPMTIAVFGSKGYVACLLTNEVKVVDLASRTVIKSIPAGVGTTGMMTANGKVYATNTGFDGATMTYGDGTVTVIDPATDAVVRTITVGTNPQAAAVAADGRIHVVCTGNYASVSGVVSVIDPARDSVAATVPIGGSPGAIAITPQGKAFVGLGGTGVAVYNASTLAVENSSSGALIGKGGEALVADGSGSVYVADFSDDKVFVLDTSKQVVKAYAVGDGPISMTLR